ncbi:MAG: hypothetical protein IJC48_10075 [Clostridia bacterium]|nr:hypothetical protein [Clostridia bacterium]
MRKENLPVSGGKKRTAILWNTAQEIAQQHVLLHTMFDVVCVTGNPIKGHIDYLPPEQAFRKQADYIYVTDEDQVKEVQQVMAWYGAKQMMVTLMSLWRFGNNRHAVKEEWIAEKLRSTQGVLLDAGAGDRPYMKYCGHLRYISQDFGKYDEESREKNRHWGPVDYNSSQNELVCDIIDIPLPIKVWTAFFVLKSLSICPIPSWP